MRKVSPRLFLLMCLGNACISLGIMFFQLSLFGNDPYTAFAMALAARLHSSYAVFSIVNNCVCFVAMLLWGRHLVGVGTFVNWLGIGPMVTLFGALVRPLWTPATLPQRGLALCLGVLVVSFGVSLYQTSDLGVSPYDAVALIMDARLPLPYFWCRIITDSLCTAGAFLLGGLVGLGTLLSALGTGPFVSFFTVHVSRRLCGKGA